MSVAAVVLAGGSGRRMGADDNKVYLPVGGRPVIDRPLEVLDAAAAVEVIIIVVRPEDRSAAAAAVGRSVASTPVHVVAGGASRTASELAALDVIESMEVEPALTLIHDGARPFLTHDLLGRLLAAADAVGGSIPGVPVTDALVEVAEGRPIGRDSSDLVRVQTPQVFRTGPLLEAFASLTADASSVDTAEVLEQHGGTVVRVVESDERNLKVTHPSDLELADRLAATWVDGAWITGR